MPPNRDQGEASEAKIVFEFAKEFNVDEVYNNESSYIGSLKSVDDFSAVEVPSTHPLNLTEMMLEVYFLKPFRELTIVDINRMLEILVFSHLLIKAFCCRMRQKPSQVTKAKVPEMWVRWMNPWKMMVGRRRITVQQVGKMKNYIMRTVCLIQN